MSFRPFRSRNTCAQLLISWRLHSMPAFRIRVFSQCLAAACQLSLWRRSEIALFIFSPRTATEYSGKQYVPLCVITCFFFVNWFRIFVFVYLRCRWLASLVTYPGLLWRGLPARGSGGAMWAPPWSPGEPWNPTVFRHLKMIYGGAFCSLYPGK